LKLFLLLMLSLSVLFAVNAEEGAQSMGAENQYSAAIERAKAEKKMLVLVIVKENCRWCEKLLYGTLADTEVQKALKKSVVVVVDKDASYPNAFKVNLFPSIFYIDYASQKSVYENVGYVAKEDFLTDLRESIKTRNALYQ